VQKQPLYYFPKNNDDVVSNRRRRRGRLHTRDKRRRRGHEVEKEPWFISLKEQGRKMIS